MLWTGGVSSITTMLCPLSFFFSAWNSRCASVCPSITSPLSHRAVFQTHLPTEGQSWPSIYHKLVLAHVFFKSHFQTLLPSEFRRLPWLILRFRFCQTLPRGCKTLKKPLDKFRSLLGPRKNKKDFQRTRTTFLPVLEGSFFCSGNTCWVCGNRLAQPILA